METCKLKLAWLRAFPVFYVWYDFRQFQLKYSFQKKSFQENRIHGLMKIPALHHEITQQMAMVYQSLGNQMLNFAFTLPYPIHR